MTAVIGGSPKVNAGGAGGTSLFGGGTKAAGAGKQGGAKQAGDVHTQAKAMADGKKAEVDGKTDAAKSELLQQARDNKNVSGTDLEKKIAQLEEDKRRQQEEIDQLKNQQQSQAASNNQGQNANNGLLEKLLAMLAKGGLGGGSCGGTGGGGSCGGNGETGEELDESEGGEGCEGGNCPETSLASDENGEEVIGEADGEEYTESEAKAKVKELAAADGQNPGSSELGSYTASVNKPTLETTSRDQTRTRTTDTSNVS